MQLLPDLIPTSPQIMVQLCDISGKLPAARIISYPTTLREATSPATYPERTPFTANCTASRAICRCMPGLATTLFQKPAALSSQTSDICDCHSSDSKIGVGTDCLRPTSFLRCCKCKAASAARASLATPRRGRTSHTSHANCPAGITHA